MYTRVDGNRFLRILVCRSLWLVLCLISGWPSHAQPNPSNADDAYVTFYSQPITLSGGLPRHKLGACKCRVFDGERQLAFLEPARFVTFRITAGPHVFSAVSWMYKHSSHGAHINLDVEPGQHYFVECGTTSFGPTFVIREIACTVAQKTGQRMRPLEPVHLRPAGTAIFVSETAFPQCR